MNYGACEDWVSGECKAQSKWRKVAEQLKKAGLDVPGEKNGTWGSQVRRYYCELTDITLAPPVPHKRAKRNEATGLPTGPTISSMGRRITIPSAGIRSDRSDPRC